MVSDDSMDDPASETTVDCVSLARLELARRIARSCATELAREIAVSGSVAAGWADADSDIELNLVADDRPAGDARRSWLAELGAEDVALDLEQSADGTWWSFFRVDGVAVEAGWQEVRSLERWLGSLRAAETVDHGALVAADALLHAVPLRTAGALARWQERLTAYPGLLGERLIADALFDWRPEWSRIPLARRGDRLRLAKVLVEDCERILRIVFAINRVWEPDWKWLARRLEALATKPPQLAERLESVVVEPDPLEAVYACSELALDTLALAGDHPDVERARAWAARQLAERDSERGAPSSAGDRRGRAREPG